MRFAFTEDQEMLRDAARAVLRAECTPERLREAWSSENGRIPGLWQTLADNGLLGILAAEPLGLGLGMLELCLVLEEAGYVALPEPLLEIAAGTVPFAHNDPRLAEVLEGKLLYFLATGEPMPFVQEWQWGSGKVGERLVSVDGSRRLARTEAPTPAVEGGTARLQLGAAAMLIGLGRRMLDMAVEYAGVRRQFGKPIGSFQAVQHHLVDARLALDFAAPTVYRAAWSLEHGPDHMDGLPPAVHVSTAKAMASDAAMTASRKALQVHGAIGYTTEYDLHMYMKRTWALAHTYGTADVHRARVAQFLGKRKTDA